MANGPRHVVMFSGGAGSFEAAWRVAMAEDGTYLGGHISSSVGYARGDMGLRPAHDWTKKRDGYAAHYPNGYRKRQ